MIFRAANKSNKNFKMNTRGMLNVKGIDINDDDDKTGGFDLRSSKKDPKKKKKGCC